MDPYLVAMEVSGSHAMWTRPDSGSCPVSDPAPAYSAVKGIFEQICRILQAEVRPIKVEICRPVAWTPYATNYRGPLRKSVLLKSGGGHQTAARVLINVCYKLHALAHHLDLPKGVEFRRRPAAMATNGGHAYQEIFNRRLSRGQSFGPVCLGLSEFLPDYVGPLREETQPCAEVNFCIPFMLKTPFGQRNNDGTWTSGFYQDVQIEGGVLTYA